MSTEELRKAVDSIDEEFSLGLEPIESAEGRQALIDSWSFHVGYAEWLVVRQALHDQEAEIARMRDDLADADERAALRSRERTESLLRAKKAEALLREALPFCDTFPDLLRDGGDELRARITAHLSENSRG